MIDDKYIQNILYRQLIDYLLLLHGTISNKPLIIIDNVSIHTVYPRNDKIFIIKY